MPTFKTLWDNFPDIEEMKKKCLNKQGKSETPFDNYCSILMSECMIRSGIQISQSTGVKCWSHSGNKHLIRAEEMARWLEKSPPSGFGRMENIQPSDFQKQLVGRTGVIFFKDYWTRNQESFENRSGDHIDLWSKNKITGGSMMYRSLIELFGFVSDLNKSRKILFWEVK
jgi:hypothetical protein